MLSNLVLLVLPFCIFGAQYRSLTSDGALLRRLGKSPPNADDNQTTTFTSGYLRTDIYDWLHDEWIQAQSLLIGHCQSSQNGKWKSAMLGAVAVQQDQKDNLRWITDHVWRYVSSDCSGARMEEDPQVVVEYSRQGQLEYRVSHVNSIEEASQLVPADSDGVLISSYHPIKGSCEGLPVRLDVMSTRCAVYGAPINAVGRFQCSANDNELHFRSFGSIFPPEGLLSGSFKDDAIDKTMIVAPVCEQEEGEEGEKGRAVLSADSSDLPSDFFTSSSSLPVKVVFRQPLTCAEVVYESENEGEREEGEEKVGEEVRDDDAHPENSRKNANHGDSDCSSAEGEKKRGGIKGRDENRDNREESHTTTTGYQRMQCVVRGVIQP